MAESQKGRKLGRNKIGCERYRKAQRREINKLRRLVKHGTRYFSGRPFGDTPSDFQAAWRKLNAVLPNRLFNATLVGKSHTIRAAKALMDWS